MGLKASEHIGKIVLDPRDSDVVYVAAQGPLWADGGDRGLYKSIDGGKNWKKVLEISERTGVTDLWYDPRDPDVLYAAAYQRRRHVWTMVDGGPESAIYKSDGRRRDLEEAHQRPAQGGHGAHRPGRLAGGPRRGLRRDRGGEQGGRHLPLDRRGRQLGEAERLRLAAARSTTTSSSPTRRTSDRVYSMDTWMHGDRGRRQDLAAGSASATSTSTTTRSGSTRDDTEPPARRLRRRPLRDLRPRRDLALLRQPAGDPVLQGRPWTTRRRSTTSTAAPRTTTRWAARRAPITQHGIMNQDWFVTTGGDGFQTRVDPTDPNIVYAESQYGGLVRYDRRNRRDSRHPAAARRRRRAAALELGLAAHHQPALAHPALLRRAPALPQRRPRRHLAGGEPRPDASARPQQAQADGPRLERRRGRQERLDLVLRQHRGARRVAAQGGPALRRHRRRPDPGQRGRRQGLAQARDVPRRARAVLRLAASTPSRFDVNTVYATFENHKKGDFKPYVLKSTDLGRTWTPITGEPAGARPGLGAGRGPRGPRPALRRHRVRRVLHQRRRPASGCSSRAACPRSA